MAKLHGEGDAVEGNGGALADLVVASAGEGVLVGVIVVAGGGEVEDEMCGGEG